MDEDLSSKDRSYRNTMRRVEGVLRHIVRKADINLRGAAPAAEGPVI